MELKDTIREIRNTRTMADFAALLGVSESGVSRYESGERVPKGAVIGTMLRVAPPHLQTALLEALGIEDVERFAASLLASADGEQDRRQVE